MDGLLVFAIVGFAVAYLLKNFYKKRKWVYVCPMSNLLGGFYLQIKV